MLGELKELWRFREFLFTMVERELRVRYKNSFVGFFWSLINPILTVLVFYFVWKFIFRVPGNSVSAYIMAAYLPYMSFQMTLMDAAGSVLNNSSIIKKVYFPREILPLAGIISNFMHLLLALAAFFIFLLAIWAIFPPHDSPFQKKTLLLPFLLIIQLALSTGLGLLVAAYNTFYEDIKYLLGVILYLMLFLCPIMYQIEKVKYGLSGWGYFLYSLNPVAELSAAYRQIILVPQPVHLGIPKGGTVDRIVPALAPDWMMLFITACVSFFVLWFGYHKFNQMKWRFVEKP